MRDLDFEPALTRPVKRQKRQLGTGFVGRRLDALANPDRDDFAAVDGQGSAAKAKLARPFEMVMVRLVEEEQRFQILLPTAGTMILSSSIKRAN